MIGLFSLDEPHYHVSASGTLVCLDESVSTTVVAGLLRHGSDFSVALFAVAGIEPHDFLLVCFRSLHCKSTMHPTSNMVCALRRFHSSSESVHCRLTISEPVLTTTVIITSFIFFLHREFRK